MAPERCARQVYAESWRSGIVHNREGNGRVSGQVKKSFQVYSLLQRMPEACTDTKRAATSLRPSVRRRLAGAAVGDGDGRPGLAARGAETLNLLDEVHAVSDLAEDDVGTVQPAGDDGGDEELGAVAVKVSDSITAYKQRCPR